MGFVATLYYRSEHPQIENSKFAARYTYFLFEVVNGDTWQLLVGLGQKHHKLV